MNSPKSQTQHLKSLATHQDDPLLNLRTVAFALGKNPTTIRNWIDQGNIRAVQQPNGLFKVRKSVLEKFLESSNFGLDESVVERVMNAQETEEEDGKQDVKAPEWCEVTRPLPPRDDRILPREPD